MPDIIASLDIDQIISSIWDENLDRAFIDIWNPEHRDPSSGYQVLNDQEAEPGQPWPYCVFEVQPRTVISRMTSTVKTQKRQIVDIPVEFRIYARETTASGKTPKQIAGELTDLVLAYFGGHPTVAPKAAAADFGNLLQVQYQSHFGTKTSENDYMMTVNYLFQMDVPYVTA